MPLNNIVSSSRQRGFTLTEALVAAAILVVIVMWVVPSYSNTIERRRIEGLVAQFEVDVRYAQSEAQARARGVRLSFRPSSAGSCYIVHTGAPAQCNCDNAGRAVCTGDAIALRAAFLPAREAVRVSSKSASIVFDALRQTVTPTATVTFTGTQGRSVQQKVNITGRVRTCSPQGSVGGYKRC